MSAPIVLPFTRRPYQTLGQDATWACDGDTSQRIYAGRNQGQLWERVAEGRRR